MTVDQHADIRSDGEIVYHLSSFLHSLFLPDFPALRLSSSSSTINQSNIQNAGVSLSLFFHIFRSFSFSSIYLFLLSSILSSVDLSIFIPFFFICSSSFPSSSLHSISYYHNHIYFKPFLFLCLKFWSFIIFVYLLSFFRVIFNSLNYF